MSEPTAQSQPTAPLGYPSEWETDVVLSDGGTARLRPITPDDATRLVEFYSRVSPESKYLRFFAPYPELSDKDVHKFTHVDYVARLALIMLVQDKMLAVGRYDATGDGEAEVAFLVQDSDHGRGIGQLLLEHLAEAARERGLTRFTADVLPQNRAMVRVFTDAGYSVERAFDDGVVRVEFPISPTDMSREVMVRREHRAEANAIRRLLHPEAIAVTGAGTDVAVIVERLTAGGFGGAITAVVTDDTPVKDVPTAASLTEVGAAADLVFTQLATDEIAAVVDEAAALNVAAVVNLAGARRATTQVDGASIVRTARANGMRVFGAQSLGLINTAPSVDMNGSPAPMPRAGVVGIYCQSAAVGVIVLSRAISDGIGVSTFLSAGSFSDVTGNDVMQYWEDDDATQVCVLSLDTLGNSRKFTRIARRLAATKPVIMFAPSHTRRGRHAGANTDLPQAPASGIDALFRQLGLLVCERRDPMYDLAQILARQPLPRGRRTKAVTTSYALADHIDSHLERNGLQPVGADVVASNELPHVIEAVTAALNDPEVDSVLCTTVAVHAAQSQAAYAELSRLARDSTKPLLGAFLDFTTVEADTETPDGRGQLPVFSNYGEAVQALAAVTRYAAWKDADHQEVAAPAHDFDAARAVVDGVLADTPEGRRLTDDEMEAVLAAWGITLESWRPVNTIDDAVAAGQELGWSVVLKATRLGMRGRADQASIFRHIDNADDMRHSWQELGKLVSDLGFGTAHDQAEALPAVQKQVPSGVPLQVRGIEDPAFGPMVSIGLSGLASDLLGDVAWAVPPLTNRDAETLLDQLRAAPLLSGYQGAAPMDRETIIDRLVRIVDLKDRLPQVSEIVCTPVMATPSGVHFLGCRIHVAPVGERDSASRELG